MDWVKLIEWGVIAFNAAIEAARELAEKAGVPAAEFDKRVADAMAQRHTFLAGLASKWAGMLLP